MNKNIDTYAISWPFSKWKICVRMSRAFILFRKSLRIEFCRIRIIIWIVMKAIYRYNHPHTSWQFHFAIRYLIIILALPWYQWGWRIFSEGLYAHTFFYAFNNYFVESFLLLQFLWWIYLDLNFITSNQNLCFDVNIN